MTRPYLFAGYAMPPIKRFVRSKRSVRITRTSTGYPMSPTAPRIATRLSWVFAGAGSTTNRSMSLSLVICPVAADPNRMILSGRATVRTRRTTSFSSVSSTVIGSILPCRGFQKPAGHEGGVELFHAAGAFGGHGGAALGRAVERLDGGGERFGIVGFHQRGVRRDLGNGGGQGRHDGFRRGHGFEQHDAKAFLNAGQAEDGGAIVFRGQRGAGHVAQPSDGALQFQLARQLAEGRGAGAVAYDAHFEVGDAAAQGRGGAQQHIDALATVEAADEEDGEWHGGRRQARRQTRR